MVSTDTSRCVARLLHCHCAHGINGLSDETVKETVGQHKSHTRSLVLIVDPSWLGRFNLHIQTAIIHHMSPCTLHTGGGNKRAHNPTMHVTVTEDGHMGQSTKQYHTTPTHLLGNHGIDQITLGCMLKFRQLGKPFEHSAFQFALRWGAFRGSAKA